jgi:prephenate dehydrogenase
MDPELHDELFAWVSHLPHMAAYGIVDSVLKKDESWVSFSGGGLRDYTRIASSNPAMWADIAISNRKYLLRAVKDLGVRLGEIEELISAGDREDLVEFFEKIAKVRRKMK